MTISTTVALNGDQLQAAIVALVPGASFVASGDLPTAGAPKVITGLGGIDDATLQTAVNNASAAFVDLVADRATIVADLKSHLTSLQAWVAANPNGAVLTAAQTLFLAKSLIGLIYLQLEQYTTTAGA